MSFDAASKSKAVLLAFRGADGVIDEGGRAKNTGDDITKHLRLSGMDFNMIPGARRTGGELVIYGYAEGVTSARKLERACLERIDFRFITGNRLPDYRRIARLKKLHLKALAGLHEQISQPGMPSSRFHANGLPPEVISNSLQVLEPIRSKH